MTTRSVATALFVSLPWLLALPPAIAATTEFCLHGEFDLGARLQGTLPAAGEFVDTSFCVTTEDSGPRVLFHGEGKSNPDMHGEFTVAFLLPDTVRIVNRGASPDLEFRPADIAHEADNYRRLDPRRLVAMLEQHPEWTGPGPGDGWRIVRYPGASRVVSVQITGGRLAMARTLADLPLRGTVPVIWTWDWSADGEPAARLEVDGVLVFRGRGSWRVLDEDEAAALWHPGGGEPPTKIPGDAWPARVAMELETLADGVYLVHGVRTGFSHLVVDTDRGLVVGDAPAGWLELTQLPPADLVPGLGVSGLSERFVDFLAAELPGRPIHAVALTHHHDDHAGGARAFAAAGASVYAPAEVAPFLEEALNRETMPPDRFRTFGDTLGVHPVGDAVTLGTGSNRVRLVSLGRGPHAAAGLGLHVEEAGFFFQSDLHVPVSDAAVPRDNRAATECWFAAWAVTNLPADTLVLNSHSRVQTPVSRLARYLEDERCRP